MTIDTERLKTDAAYWEEVAPEGAIYFDTESELFFNDQGYWPVLGPFKVSYSQNRCSSRFISRPGHEGNSTQAPAAPEWDGEGLPPVGCECELKIDQSDWLRGTVKYVNKCGVVFKPWGTKLESFISSATTAIQFRPIRTKEQRQREELIDIMAEQTYLSHIAPRDAKEIADAILSRYNLEPKL